VTTPEPLYDLAARPATYWPDELTLEQRIGRIKGLFRRRRAQELLELGELDASHPVLTETLPEDVRASATATHPLLMGGEYLPELDEDDGEVEIGRIELLSTTGDTFSIRARRAGETIAYRMVDEYGNDYDLGTSAEPLTLAEVIARLDATDVGYSGSTDPSTVPECFLAMNLENDSTVDGLRAFVTVTSPFYDDLEPYYDARATRFLDRWEVEHATDHE
jgi:hypothetical protein